MDLWSLIVMATVSALIDSFDPCFYALFTTILLSAFMVNYRYAVKVGLVFIISVYIGYYAISLAARILLRVLSLPFWILAILLLLYGFFILLFTIFVKTRYNVKNESEIVCRENDLPCKVASRLNLQRYVSRGLVTVFTIGLLSSFTILPCSAQLLLAYIVYTYSLDYLMWSLLTAYYVALFVLPVVLLFLGLLGLTRVPRLHRLIVEHEDKVKIIGALVMIAVAVYLLVFL